MCTLGIKTPGTPASTVFNFYSCFFFEKKNIIPAGVPDVILPGAHTIHPIAMKLSQVMVNMPAVVLEI